MNIQINSDIRILLSEYQIFEFYSLSIQYSNAFIKFLPKEYIECWIAVKVTDEKLNFNKAAFFSKIAHNENHKTKIQKWGGGHN